jgi:hypothetical protein
MLGNSVANMVGNMYWLTTNPNPRASAKGFDAGQRGWKCHAVEGEKFSEVKYVKAACGLRAKHGWGMDLFIEAKCKKCLKALGEI